MQYTGIFRKTILVAAIAAAFASPAQAATPISGNFSGPDGTVLFSNHTLTSGNLDLDGNHRLFIHPDASLRYEGGWRRGQGWGAILDLDTTNISGGGVLINQGLFVVSGNGIYDIIRNSFHQGRFSNSGVFRKTDSTVNHVTRIDALFHNSGRIEVQSGTLSFERGSTHGGGEWRSDGWNLHWRELGGEVSIDIGNAATLRFAGGYHSLSSGARVSGSGTLNLTGDLVDNHGTIAVGYYDQSGGHFGNWGNINTSAFTQSGGSFDNRGNINTSTFTQHSGWFSGTSNLTVTDTATFSGWITQSGSRVTRLQGASTLASGYFGLDTGRTLINDSTGVFTWSGGNLELAAGHPSRFDGGGFLNHGEFIASGNGANVIRNSARAGIFDNTGTFRKTGSSADHVTHIDALFLNAGTVAVETGSLRMNGGFINDGRFELAAGARVSNSGGDFVNSGVLGGNGVFDPGTTLVNNGTIAPGNSIGALTVLGDLTQTASSAMEFELASLHSFDTLSVFGNLTLDGVLRIIGLGGYNPAVGDSFTLIRFDDGLADASDLSGVFANVQWSGFNPGLRFDVAYHSNSLVVTAVPVPAAVWLFASGLLGVLTLGRRRVV